MTTVLTLPSTKSQTGTLTIRPGTVADSYTVFKIFEETLADLILRFGSAGSTGWSDPAALARTWAERRSLYEHLAQTAAQFWIAERAGRPVGFSRGLRRGEWQQLTEFFVLPGEQSSGIGRELYARAFPDEGAAHRSIIATTDSRAQTLYLRAGVYPRFPIYYFGREPEIVTVKSELTFVPMASTPETLKILGTIDRQIIGHRRDDDHLWLMANRQGYLYCREGQPVGYGYLGVSNGPFALLQEADFPAVLAHAESEAARHRRDFGLEVPMINQAAVDYLVGRSFKMDWFAAIFMSNVPFGQFQNYIMMAPPFFA